MVVLISDGNTSEEGGDLIAGNFVPELVKLKHLEHASGYLSYTLRRTQTGEWTLIYLLRCFYILFLCLSAVVVI